MRLIKTSSTSFSINDSSYFFVLVAVMAMGGSPLKPQLYNYGQHVSFNAQFHFLFLVPSNYKSEHGVRGIVFRIRNGCGKPNFWAPHLLATTSLVYFTKETVISIDGGVELFWMINRLNKYFTHLRCGIFNFLNWRALNFN